jgi:hypothetical protein
MSFAWSHRPLRPRLVAVRLVALALLMVSVSTVVTGGQAADAAIPDRWGFALNDNPTPPAGYVMPTSRQWGSWKTSFPASWATVSPFGTGVYRVVFPQIPSKAGVAQVTAVNAGAVFCQVDSFGAAGATEFVYVRCFRPGGAPTNSAFSVTFSESSGTSTTGAYASVLGEKVGGIRNSFNSSGAVNSAGHTGTGKYDILLRGMGSATVSGNVQVTAVGSVAARCAVTTWASAATALDVKVACVSATGAPSDTAYSLSYSVKRTVFGAANPPKLFGYVFDTLGSLPAATNFNSTGATNTVASAGTGLRLVTLPGVGKDPSNVQVTAFGTVSTFCNLLAPWTISGSNAVVRDVACYSFSGARVSSASQVAYASRF